MPILARHDFVPIPLDYGFFSVMRLISSRQRKKKVDWLREKMECIPEFQQGGKLSVIAHSFGTYLVAELIEKYQMLRFDKIIFAGSIVNEDYDWHGVLSRRQVNLFRNDYGRLDPWPQLAKTIVPRTGNSGQRGFSRGHPLMVQRPFPGYQHSDYFHVSHFEREWIPMLKTIVLENGITVDPVVQSRVLDTMSVAIQLVGQQLNIDPVNLRANLFAQDEDNRLSIPPGLHYNMLNSDELTISIPVGAGCTGRAYSTGEYAIAVFGADWGQHTLPLPQLSKVDKRLHWIFSMPIPDIRSDEGLLGIFNVDCLNIRKTAEEIKLLQENMKTWAQAIARQLTGGS